LAQVANDQTAADVSAANARVSPGA